MAVVLRATGDSRRLAPTVQKLVLTQDRELPVFNVRPMDRLLADSVGARRFHTIVSGVFAAVALILAVTGLYGVMAHWVSQRTPELGIRMALGAQMKDVLRLVVGQGLALAAFGVALGAAGALALTKMLSRLLYAVKPGDPAIFTRSALLLLAVAIAASYIPARRAAAIDPLAAIRHE
jgi:putative ABC transport system permease protein